MQAALEGSPTTLADGVRAALALGLGVLLVLVAGWVRAGAEPGTSSSRAARGPAAWIAADRDGDALIELDADLFELGRVGVERPLFVRSTAQGIWVVHAARGAPRGPHRLAHGHSLRGLGEVAVLDEVLDLTSDRLGRALVLVRGPGAGVRLERIELDGRACTLEVPAGAVRMAHGGRSLGLVLGEVGWARWDEPAQVWVTAGALAGEGVCDLAGRPDGGWWLLLTRRGEGHAQLQALDARGVPRLQYDAGDARRLSRGAGPEPWLWCPDTGSVQRQSTAAPTLAAQLAQGGARAAVADAQGGLLVAAPGALLRLDAQGRALPGQGGFTRLVDLAQLRGPAP